MISELARQDAEKLAKDGIVLSFADVVRINALGLKVEKSLRSAERVELPRVAFFGDVVFHEPTVAHRLWIERAERSTGTVCDLRVTAYALAAADPARLCDPDNAASVTWHAGRLFARGWFRKGPLSGITRRQLENALSYVVGGNDPTTGERPSEADGGEAKEAGSIAAGMLIDGVALRVGSLAEVARMTSSEILRIAEFRRRESGTFDRDAEHARAAAEYCATLDEIRRTRSN